MSLKTKSLGLISGSVTSGIAITGGTNATPIVATITTGHGLKNGDRLHISGVTGNTGMNGEWTLNFLTDTTAQLLGSKGNGTYGGTPVANVICDASPFLPNHSAVANIGGAGITAGTYDIEGHDGTESSAGVLDTSKWVKCSQTNVAGTLPDGTLGTVVEVKLMKYMRATVKSALTGSAKISLLA